VIALTCQVTALLGCPLMVAVNCCEAKTSTVAGFGETVTVPVPADVIVTDAEADLDVFAVEVAVTVTVVGFGGEFGAVYRPFEEIMPTVELPPIVPFTAQVTPVLDVPLTLAVNCWV